VSRSSIAVQGYKNVIGVHKYRSSTEAVHLSYIGTSEV
jgi:hypothetical protein